MFKFNWFKARSSTKAVAVASKNVEPSTFEISAIPDSAHGFGRKIVWFAVNSPDHNEVASVLGLSNVKPANWNSGLTIAYDNTNSTEYEHHAFLTPSIDGWVFILSPHFIEMTGQITEDPSQDIQSGFNHLFRMLYTAFSDVQIFGSHRVVDAILWGRALDGVITRLFYYADGTVYTNYGELTEKEHAMNMLDIGGLSPDDAVSAIYENMEKEDELETKLLAEGKSRAEVEKQVADKIKLSPTHDEDLHFSLAEAWSISPDNLDQRGLAESVGVIGKLPKAVLG